LAEVVHVLVGHGFSDLVHRAGLHEGLPAKVLRSLRLIEAPDAEPETVAARFRMALQDLGPAFIKLGQVLSTRPDLLDKRVCDELGRLQDQVSTLSFDEMRPVIERDLGEPLEALFGSFETEPFAAASLSQVYRATLKDDHPVVVKVQRPGARATIEADLSLMRAIADWVSEHVHDFDWLDPVGTVEEFARSIRRELDFAIETHVIERFHDNFKDDDQIFVPQVYGDYCSSHVITMDYVDGVRIDAVDELGDRQSEAKTVAQTGAASLCRQIFEFQLFHADPHPGNVLVTWRNQIAFLDYGMVGHLEHTDAVAMADVFRAMVQRDAEACVVSLLSFTTSGHVENHEAFVHEVAEYIEFEAEPIVSKGEVGKAIEQLTLVLRRHQLQLAPRFSLLLKALATIESTGHRLDPSLDMVPLIQPHVERLIVQRYSPKHLLQEAQTQVSALLRLGRDLPNDIRNLLRMMRSGRVKIQLTHEGLSNLASVIDRASNRITFGLITAAIIVGSSLIVQTGDTFQPIALGGYVMAGVLGLALLVSILRSRNF
jgi:ubiquinone biosynthesis protein